MGHQVVCLDNLSSGSLKNIEKFSDNENYEFIEADVKEPLALTPVDGIFNLACPASPPFYQLDPVETLRTNVQGAISVLELARESKIRVLQASTSEIYGDPEQSPQTEHYWGNVNTIGIRSCYDEGKRAAETLFFDYHRQYDVDIRLVRIFNTYGPGMAKNDGRVVSNFCVQALTGEDITIYGEGEQTRSFCYVDDLIDGLIACFFNENAAAMPINLGNPAPIDMKTLSAKIIELTGSNSSIRHEELPSDDPKLREPSILRAKEVLGWEPRIGLDVGLRLTIEYFKTLL
jgi:UDP-glucuronate decarboxylase